MTGPHSFWQEILDHDPSDGGTDFLDFYPALLQGGRALRLPIRPLADGRHALASLIINQASFAVQDALAADLATALRPYRPEIIVGLPTLGLTLASAVARALGHPRYLPLGTSRKFWYREDLSVPLSSITTPEQQKRLYIDPRMQPLLEGRRVVLIDDVISSGASISAGLSLLALCAVTPVAIGAAMLQSERWRDRLASEHPQAGSRVVSVFSTPLLARTDAGMWRAPAAVTNFSSAG